MDTYVKHTGRVSQTYIYLGKLFRMFIFMVLPTNGLTHQH